MQSDWLRISVASLAVAAGASMASAGLSEVVFHIEANDGNGNSDTWRVNYNVDAWTGDRYNYTLPDEIVLSNGAVEIARLTDVTLTYVEDPQVHLSFSVTAGGAATNFTISSAVLSFPSISPAVGQATASLTVTDLGGGAGASASSASGSIYEAYYNGASVFASLLTSPVTAPASGMNLVSESSPMAGFSPIAGAVVDMSAQYSFTLSANDSATGTSTWIVVPSPAAAAMFSFAGVLGIARRRR